MEDLDGGGRKEWSSLTESERMLGEYGTGGGEVEGEEAKGKRGTPSNKVGDFFRANACLSLLVDAAAAGGPL